jgi:subtilisin family serine protease
MSPGFLSSTSGASIQSSLLSITAKYGTHVSPLFHGIPGADDPALAKYYSAYHGGSKQSIKELLFELRSHAGVDAAYVTSPAVAGWPVPKLAEGREVPSTTPGVKLFRRQGTPSFFSNQGYLQPAVLGGLGVVGAQRLPGGKGKGVQVFDIEYRWNQNHEDLRVNFPSVVGGTIVVNNTQKVRDDTHHGTAVAGVIGGDENNFGIEGIAPDANFFGVSQFPSDDFVRNDTTNTARAILTAANMANPGDVILVEVQRGWQPFNFDILLPVEW